MISGYIGYSGAKIYYEEKGEGDVLVVLHGNGENINSLSEVINQFSKHFRVIAIDCRGRGKSTFGDKKIDMEIMAKDTFAVLDALDVKDAHFLGFSDGANIIMQMAIMNAARIVSAVLISGNMFYKGFKFSTRILLMMMKIWATFKSLFSENAKKEKMLVELMTKYPKYNLLDFTHCQMPVFVIAGDKDLVSLEHTELIAKSFANSTLKILEDSTHFEVLLHPQRIVDEINGYYLKNAFIR